ncbi:MAG: endo-1,4-beta-xylanase, partial [Planctomycetaceae bacterium]|nr:endo-1,4-beta-xylanase [Planctomycetaceae bacterium]
MNRIAMLLIGLFVFCFAVAVAAGEPPLPNPDVMSKEYWDIWNDSVQTEIDKRIEQYRKANAAVFLTDVKPGTEVKIEQISHDFLFGANIFNFNQLGSKELDDKYKMIFGELLNSATIPFYWTQLEMDRGTVRYQTCAEDNPEFWAKSPDPTKERFWRRPATDQIVEFCEQKNIFRHGHTLIWGSRGHGVPKWLKMNPEDAPEMEKLFEARILDIAKRYGDRIQRWDVVNESATDPLNPHHSKHDANNPKG